MSDHAPLARSDKTNREPDGSRCDTDATSTDMTRAVLRRLADAYTELDRMNARLAQEMTAHHQTTTKLEEEIAHRETTKDLARRSSPRRKTKTARPTIRADLVRRGIRWPWRRLRFWRKGK